ncbi:MAG: SDR family oxidoreductase [Ferruginibacter sp.]|nr:SDR family oxidoreductase [Ferruginibacter sp.]
MNDFFKGKTIAITGGSDGIGKAMVELFLAAGAHVSTCARSEQKLEYLQTTNKDKPLLCVAADVSVYDDCKNFINKTILQFGGIDILINNAGISMRAELKDADVDVFKKVMDINYLGTVYCTKLALESIIKNKGTIVGVSSIAGYRGLPGRSGYSASKFAVNGWLEAVRTELLDDGVNVMWVCPGFTKSNIRNAALNEIAEAQGESPLDEASLMTAEECAQHILNAIIKRKRTLVLTFTGKRTVFINKFFAGWADRLTRNFFYKNGKLIK